jgi:ADP-ribose pyrophosphatase YjhB (NUDIX family)
MPPVSSQIRVIALCLFSRDGAILVNEGHDPIANCTFVRPLGGAIEFGETGSTAVIREIREELGAEVRSVRYLGTFENLFTYLGEQLHEVVLVYDARFADGRLYEQPYLEGRETDGGVIRASWRELDGIAQSLVPANLHGFLRSRLATAT